MNELTPERRRRLTHRALPAAGGLARSRARRGMIVGAGRAVDRRAHGAATSPRPGSAGTTRAMHALLDDALAGAPIRCAPFRRAYRDAAATATAMRRRRRASPAASDDGTVAVPVDAAHARVRPRPRRASCVPGDDGERVTWSAAAGVPRPARAASALARAAGPPERAHAPLARRQGAGRGARPTRAPRRSAAIAGSIAGHAGARGRPRPSATRALRARLPARLARRAERPRARLREPARGASGRRAAGRRRACSPGRARARPRPVRTTIDTAPPGGRGGGARRPLRRRRRARPAQRRDPRARRHRLLGAPAPGLDLQDRDHHGRARGPGGEADAREFPVADARR